MELKKVVNLMPDDKFLDYYIEMSEFYNPNQCSYIVFSNEKDLKYIKSKNKNISILPKNEDSRNKLLSNFSGVEKIVFHSLNKYHSDLVDKLSSEITKIWLFWGFDGYITRPKSYFINHSTSKLRFGTSLRERLRFLKNHYYSDKRISNTGKLHIRMIRNMNYCATWVQEDIKLAQKINPNIKSLYFNYYTNLLMSIPESQDINKDLKTILLGNSGSEYNNHIEALLYLRDIRFQGVIYCPLSYNGGSTYKLNVERLGKKFFGDNFIAFRELLPLSEYQQIINTCDVVWMNHRRQQAAGNIFAALAMGKVVILDPRNPLKETFDDWGMKLFDKDILLKKNIIQTELRKNFSIKNKLTFEMNVDFFRFLFSFK